MGRSEEDEEGQKELDILEEFFEKYNDESLTLEDIRNLNIHLRIADIVCLGVANSKEEISELKAKNNIR